MPGVLFHLFVFFDSRSFWHEATWSKTGQGYLRWRSLSLFSATHFWWWETHFAFQRSVSSPVLLNKLGGKKTPGQRWAQIFRAPTKSPRSGTLLGSLLFFALKAVVTTMKLVTNDRSFKATWEVWVKNTAQPRFGKRKNGPSHLWSRRVASFWPLASFPEIVPRLRTVAWAGGSAGFERKAPAAFLLEWSWSISESFFYILYFLFN